MKRIVCCVEGEGEVTAVPVLLKKLLTEMDAWDAVVLDKLPPLRIGHPNRLAKNNFQEWRRKLRAAVKRPNVGGILYIADGDLGSFRGEPFCPAKAAAMFAEQARDVGAGVLFSLGIVFACCEFESWLIAGVNSLAGKPLPDGRPGVAEGSMPPEGDLEVAPRDAKGWFRSQLPGGYSPTRDQADLTSLVDVDAIRSRPMRSFRRLDSAVGQLVASIRDKAHSVSPQLPTE